MLSSDPASFQVLTSVRPQPDWALRPWFWISHPDPSFSNGDPHTSSVYLMSFSKHDLSSCTRGLSSRNFLSLWGTWEEIFEKHGEVLDPSSYVVLWECALTAHFSRNKYKSLAADQGSLLHPVHSLLLYVCQEQKELCWTPATRAEDHLPLLLQRTVLSAGRLHVSSKMVSSYGAPRFLNLPANTKCSSPLSSAVLDWASQEADSEIELTVQGVDWQVT